MSLSDLKNSLVRRFFRGEGDASRRPDGGTSCYRPIRKKNRTETQEQADQQPLTYIHTGFTGMNPPAAGYGTEFGVENYGRQEYSQTGYAQSASSMSGPGAGPCDQAGYTDRDPRQTFGNPQDLYSRQTAYSSAYGGNPGGFQAEEPPAAAARPERGWFPPREESSARNNISYMPGYAPDNGAAPFSHVEHIMILTGLKSCYEAIECMKNGETLIVVLDAIANESESMRCQDMLAGAAFTLGCSVRMLQGAKLVLIAPEGVKILPEESVSRSAIAPPAYTVPAQEREDRQRERRSGRNAADWNAARSGQMDGYNPYTGTMPVAAGAYGSFGGYGY